MFDGYGYFSVCLTENKIINQQNFYFVLFHLFQHVIGNGDKSSVVVRTFSSPFAAQFVRILPKNHNIAQCMRVDLFGCRDCKCSI